MGEILIYQVNKGNVRLMYSSGVQLIYDLRTGECLGEGANLQAHKKQSARPSYKIEPAFTGLNTRMTLH